MIQLVSSVLHAAQDSRHFQTDGHLLNTRLRTGHLFVYYSLCSLGLEYHHMRFWLSMAKEISAEHGFIAGEQIFNGVTFAKRSFRKLLEHLNGLFCFALLAFLTYGSYIYPVVNVVFLSNFIQLTKISGRSTTLSFSLQFLFLLISPANCLSSRFSCFIPFVVIVSLHPHAIYFLEYSYARTR